MVAPVAATGVLAMNLGLLAPRAFAQTIGVTRQAVEKAITRGRIPIYDESGASVPADYKGRKFVREDEARAAFKLSRARVDDAALAEMAADLDRELSLEPIDQPAQQETSSTRGSLVGAKTTKEELQADLLRLRLARERGELIARQAQIDAFETAGRQVSRQFLAMASWAEEVHGVSRTGGVPALTAWFRAKANELCMNLANTLVAPSEPEPEADDDSDRPGPA